MLHCNYYIVIITIITSIKTLYIMLASYLNGSGATEFEGGSPEHAAILPFKNKASFLTLYRG